MRFRMGPLQRAPPPASRPDVSSLSILRPLETRANALGICRVTLPEMNPMKLDSRSFLLVFAVLPSAVRAQEEPAPKAPIGAAIEAPVARPEVAQPAPELKFSQWTVDAPPPGTQQQVVRTGTDIAMSRSAMTLAELNDHVVIVHTFSWDDGNAVGRALPLIRDLLTANSDRQLAAIGIADKLEREVARANATSLQLRHPIALEAFVESRSPYVGDDPQRRCWAFVVGRGGGLLWQGNPATGEKEFLAAVKDALDLPTLVRIDHPLHERLAKALPEYYAGRISRALALAEVERLAAQKLQDIVLQSDALLLDRVAREVQFTWLREAQEAAAKHDSTNYVALANACKQAFTRAEFSRHFERLDKEARKNGFFETRLSESQKYFDLLAERPALFPARRDSAGDKFAKKLESFARSTPNSTLETRTAKALADRYQLTAR